MPEHSASSPDIDTRMGGWTGVGYGDIEIGSALPARVFVITPDDMRRFRQCLGEPPREVAEGEPVPVFLLNELKTLKAHLRLPPGVLHAREELVLEHGVVVGETLETRVRIADKYIRNGKRFVVVEQAVHRAQDQRRAVTVRHVLYWPC